MHGNIINIMNALGYRVHPGGVCHGVVMMGIQACLTGNIDSFNRRLEYMQKRSPNEWVLALTRFRENLDTRNKPIHLSEEEQNLIDVLAFFDGIKLSQEPEKKPEYFAKSLTQDDNTDISKLVGSIALEEQGDLLQVRSFGGIYKDDELADYINFLNDMAKDVKQPFSLLLNGKEHSIALHYDSKLNDWYIIDANELPLKRKYIDLASWIKSALFEKSDMTAFETTVYLTGNALETAKNINNFFDTSTKFKILQGKPLMRLAVEESNLETIHMLLASGISMDSIDKYGTTLAHIAVYADNGAEIIKILHTANVDLNKADEEGKTPAHLAALFGKDKVIAALYEAKVDLNQADSDGNTLAHLVEENNQIETLKLLHKIGVDLNQANKAGRTPVMFTVIFDKTEMVKAFCEAGADLNKVDKDGATALHHAVERKNMDVLKVLISAKADLNLKNKKGQTPADLAISLGWTEAIKLLTPKKIIEPPTPLFKSTRKVPANDDVFTFITKKGKL